MNTSYLQAIRTFEGFQQRARWDYAQHSNGYGTKALYPGEVIDAREADRRFRSEIDEAQAMVEKFAPSLDDGTKAALTSLTFNAGPSWMTSGLGAAVRAGDMDEVRRRFVQYTKAGGETLPGLVKRRAQEVAWIAAAPPTSSPVLAAMPQQVARHAEVKATAAVLPPIPMHAAAPTQSAAKMAVASAHNAPQVPDMLAQAVSAAFQDGATPARAMGLTRSAQDTTFSGVLNDALTLIARLATRQPDHDDSVDSRPRAIV